MITYKSIIRALIFAEVIKDYAKDSGIEIEEIQNIKKLIGELTILLNRMVSIEEERSRDMLGLNLRDGVIDRSASLSIANEVFNEGESPVIKKFEKPHELAGIYEAYERTKKRFSSLGEDFDFFIDCLTAIVVRGETSNVVFTLIKDIISNVVLQRNTSYEKGREYLNMLRSGSQLGLQQDGEIKDSFQLYLSWTILTDFNQILRSILSQEQWKLL